MIPAPQLIVAMMEHPLLTMLLAGLFCMAVVVLNLKAGGIAGPQQGKNDE